MLAYPLAYIISPTTLSLGGGHTEEEGEMKKSGLVSTGSPASSPIWLAFTQALRFDSPSGLWGVQEEGGGGASFGSGRPPPGASA